MTGLVQILAKYPLGAVEHILSPISGIPSRHSFLPSLAEIKAELDGYMASIHRSEERAAIFDRSRMLPAPPPLPKLTIEEMREKYGDNWGLTPAGKDKQRKSWIRPIAELLKEAGLSAEEFEKQKQKAREKQT